LRAAYTGKGEALKKILGTSSNDISEARMCNRKPHQIRARCTLLGRMETNDHGVINRIKGLWQQAGALAWGALGEQGGAAR